MGRAVVVVRDRSAILMLPEGEAMQRMVRLAIWEYKMVRVFQVTAADTLAFRI